MTLAVDTSALVARHLAVPARAVAVEAMRDDPDWCASALALTEALVLIDRLTDDPGLRTDLEDAVRLDWDRLAVVPLDAACLDRAAELARARPLRLSDSLHLAAADRLPRPLRFLTFDPGQIPVALALGFEVVST
jgi:predicted nucleic acid-binding protein